MLSEWAAAKAPVTFRTAALQDLPQIKTVYQKIVRHMNAHHIGIWDEHYPFDFLEEDIQTGRLYLLLHRSEIISAFALCGENAGETSIDWEHPGAKALYLDRFAVNARYMGKGVGGYMLAQARRTARCLGAEYLRLFVVDSNTPALRLYEKSGFLRRPGVYDEVIDDTLMLHEYGYEVNGCTERLLRPAQQKI